MYIYGDRKMPVPENLSFSKCMLDGLRRAKGDEICLENGETREKLTYKEVTQYTVNLSVALTQLGVQRGDVVAIGSNPYLHFIPTALAVIFAGATYTSFNENIGRPVLRHRLELVKPKYLICSLVFWQTYIDLIKGFDCIKTYIAVDDVPDLKLTLTALVSVNEDVDSYEPVHVHEKTDTAVINFSSGTTGMPKGIELSHFNCLSGAMTRGTRSGPNNFTTLRTGLIVSTWSSYVHASMTFWLMSQGSKIVFAIDLPIKRTLQILRDCKVEVVTLYPAYLCEILQNSQPTDDYFDYLKVIFCAGSPLTAELKKEFQKSLPKVKYIIQVYASNECNGITVEPWGNNKPGSIGKAKSNVIIKVVDPKTRAVLGPNQVGEICVKSPAVMKGYLNINRTAYEDDEGFFLTKDLGYYDEEEYFFFVGRISDMIHYKWHKVSPLELEKILLQHPAVLDAGVIGRPAAIVDEVPMAFVVRKPATDVSEDELIKFVDSQVTPQMQLRGGVMFIPEVPRNSLGKILRQELKELLIKTMSS